MSKGTTSFCVQKDGICLCPEGRSLSVSKATISFYVQRNDLLIRTSKGTISSRVQSKEIFLCEWIYLFQCLCQLEDVFSSRFSSHDQKPRQTPIVKAGFDPITTKEKCEIDSVYTLRDSPCE